jgi:hypothetical protein
VKKASLGFQYISLDDEFRIPEDKDIEDSKIDRILNMHDKEKRRKLRNYREHRDAYNRQKRSVARSITGRYEESKRKAFKEGIEWSFDRETWEQMWIGAGWIRHPSPPHSPVPAFALRGQNRYNNTCMIRKDLARGWSPENSCIVFRGEELIPGSRWYLHGAE